MTDIAGLRAAVREVSPTSVELRRRLHQRPELANQEFETTQLIAGVLEEAALATNVRSSGTGLVADLGHGPPSVAFRADLDAVPISEATGAPYASEIPERMHACGHDVHAAIAVGTALSLQRIGGPPGRVRFLFQHAEEAIPGGALDLTNEGALDGIDAIVAFHVDPALETGRLGLRAGPITSSSDRFEITVEGPGGHTARPHETVDTIYAAARVVAEVPTLLHRAIDSRRPLALVFGRIHGGMADNVIPTKVELSGTCRLMDRELWDEIPAILDRLVTEVVAPTGAKAVVHYQRGIPPVVNSPEVVAEVEFAIAETFGTEAVADTQPSLGAEDFARFSELVPGALVRLGAKLPDRVVPLHSSTFDIDESAIEVGILAGAASLLRLLGSQ